jgi:hypothetical protein
MLSEVEEQPVMVLVVSDTLREMRRRRRMCGKSCTTA